MKSKITHNELAFSPITIEITVESLDELQQFWHRFNISDDTAAQCSQSVPKGSLNSIPLWFHLNDLLVQRNGKI